MAKPTPGNTSSSATFGPNNSSFSHTVPAGSNRILHVVIAGWFGGGTSDISTVTYGGSAMTKVADSGFSGGRDKSTIWRILNPTAGAANVAVTYSSPTDSRVISAEAISYTDASQGAANTAATATGSSNSPSVSVTATPADDFVLDGLAFDATSATATMVADTDRTQLLNNTTGGEGKGISEDQSASSSEVMNWSLTASTTWAMAGIAVSGIASGGGGSPTLALGAILRLKVGR